MYNYQMTHFLGWGGER